MHNLSGKVAIITGAASGIGKAQAELLAAHGATVIVADVNPAGANVAEAIGEKALFAVHDVTSEGDWAALVELTKERFGSVDILINTAGISISGSITETTAETFTKVWQVNTLGVFLGIKAVVEPMKQAGGGVIINVASAAAFRGYPGTHAYSASKWAVRGLSKTTARELASSGIRVNSIYPGPVDTPLLRNRGQDPDQIAKFVTDVGFAAQPEDIAQATLFLVSNEARYAYGAELCVDGGQSI